MFYFFNLFNFFLILNYNYVYKPVIFNQLDQDFVNKAIRHLAFYLGKTVHVFRYFYYFDQDYMTFISLNSNHH